MISFRQEAHAEHTEKLRTDWTGRRKINTAILLLR